MVDDMDDKAYPSNSYGLTYQKLSGENFSHPQNVANRFVSDDDEENEDDMEEDEGGGNDDEEDEEEEEEDEDEDEDDGSSGVQRIGKDGYKLRNYNDGADADDDFGDMQKHPKKRKLKTLLSNYVFAPRAPASSSFQKPAHGGRDPSSDWTEHETSILLNTWGDRYLKLGRKSLHSEEWQEVAEKVSQESKIERTDAQCRSRLDTLKKKYKKEKMKSCSKWEYFSQMDDLLSAPSQQQPSLPCGVDAGEFIFMNPKVYLDRANGLDEMRDSPENSESEEDEDMEDLSPRKAASLKILADSIHKFNEVYQKVENSKRQQILELEKMRMNFHRELELQKKQILERAHAEIQKIRGEESDDDHDDDEASGDNDSG